MPVSSSGGARGDPRRSRGRRWEVGTVIARLTGQARPAPVPEEPAGPAAPTDAAEPRRPRVSPVVGRMVAVHDLDLSMIAGSGLRGRVTKQDVLAHLDSPSEERPLHSESPYVPDPEPPRPAGLTDRGGSPEPLSRMRHSIGVAMRRSQETAATCHTVVECDMSRVESHRRRLGTTALPLVCRSVIETLRDFPELNATLDGTTLTRYERVHLGIAVSLGGDGLIVPVINDAQDLSVEGLGSRIKDLARRARAKQLEPDDVQGATFTVTNPGASGAVFATPIINVPQVGILDLEAIVRRPVVLTDAEGSESIAVRPMGEPHSGMGPSSARRHLRRPVPECGTPAPGSSDLRDASTAGIPDAPLAATRTTWHGLEAVNEVQTLTDSLAVRLRRPVGVDDRRFRAVAYSSHEDEIDAVRRTSILGRRAPPPVIAWLEGLDIFVARDLVHIPANPELGMVTRLCFPLRFGDRLLGFLWLVEASEPLDVGELAVCREAGAALAEALFRLEQEADEDRRRESRAVAEVLDPAGPSTATPSIARAPWYSVLQVSVSVPRGSPAPPALDLRLAEAVDRLRRTVPPQHQIASVTQQDAVIVLAASTGEEIDEYATTLFAAVRSELAGLPDAQPRLGVGDHVETLSEVAVSAAARTPRHADGSDHAGCRTHRALARPRCASPARGPGRRPVADRAPTSSRSDDFSDSGTANGWRPPLRHTLTTPETQRRRPPRSRVHRSTLYDRLHRIERITGMMLRSGPDRLELHLGLRLWRMGTGDDAQGR